MCGSPMDDEKWKVDSAIDTLLRAEEIKADKELMAKVTEKMAAKKKAINSIAGLKKRKAELESEDEEG